MNDTRVRSASRITGLLAGIGLVAALLAACGSSSSDDGPADGPVKVRLATLPAVTPMILQVAEQEGFFKDNDLEVEVTQSTDLGTFIPALGRQYDVVMSTPSDFLAAADQGFKIAALPGAFLAEADGFDDPAVVSSEAGSIKELAGKTIGTNSLAGLQYVSLLKALADNGVKDAKLVQVPFPSMVDQLTKGKVDAVTVAEPWRSQLLADSSNQALFVPSLEAMGLDSAPVAWYTANQDWIADHPGVVGHWKAAMQSAIDWVKDPVNEDAFRQILVAQLKLTPEQAKLVEMPAYQIDIAPADLQAYVDLLTGADQLKNGGKNLDTTTLVAADG